MLIEYRTIEGEIVSRYIDSDHLTINDIDCLTNQYFEKTGRIPSKAFIDLSTYAQLQKDMSVQVRNYAQPTPSGLLEMKFYLSLGTVRAVVVRSSYIPVLVGSKAEFEDNDMHKIFEETVLKDCDRE